VRRGEPAAGQLGPVGRAEQRRAIVEVLELELCVQELTRRASTDVFHAELWQLKRDVAERLLCLRQVRRGPTPAAHDHLTDEQRDHVLRNHPLLRYSRPRKRGPAAYRQEEWFMEIRRKVEAYFALRDVGETSSGAIDDVQ